MGASKVSFNVGPCTFGSKPTNQLKHSDTDGIPGVGTYDVKVDCLHPTPPATHWSALPLKPTNT